MSRREETLAERIAAEIRATKNPHEQARAVANLLRWEDLTWADLADLLDQLAGAR